MSSTSLYETTPQTGTVSSENLTSLYSNQTSFTTGIVNSAVYSVNGGTGVTVNPTTGNVVVSIGQDVATTANVQFANVTATGNLSNNYFTLANSVGTTGQVLTTNGSGATSWTSLSSLGVSSITGTANQVIVSNPTGAVTLSLPQDIATTSTPTFAGANLGNITVGVATDNTITTTSGNLVLDANSNLVTVDGAFSVLTNNLYVDVNKVGINTITPSQELTVNANGDGYCQIGMENTERTWLVTNNDGDDLISYSVVPSGGFSINRLQFNATTGDQWFPTGRLGVATGAPAYTLDVNGDAKVNTNFTVGGVFQINGGTSGYSTFIAPTVGANINYQLPAAQGAANTVLTNDGVGNLSWALPGGGGSTFGNVTVGVATDNTISTTTGDLVLDSTSGTIAMNVPTITTDATTLNLFNTTTTTLNLAGAATAVNLGTSNSSFSLGVGLRSTIGTTTLTTTSTAIATVVSTTRNAMKVMVHMIQGANVHLVEALLLKTGTTTAMLTTYGEMYNTTPLANFTADVSGTSMRLLATPTSATSTVFYAVRTTLD